MTWLMTLGELAFYVRRAGLNRTIILYAVVTGLYLGVWNTILWFTEELTLAWGDTSTATEPIGTKIRHTKPNFGLLLPLICHIAIVGAW